MEAPRLAVHLGSASQEAERGAVATRRSRAGFSLSAGSRSTARAFVEFWIAILYSRPRIDALRAIGGAFVSIELETVRHIARLANLELSEDEVRVTARELSAILGYIDKLNELDTARIEPTSHVTRMERAFREDRVLPSLEVERALANAPETEDGHFTVPKVIG